MGTESKYRNISREFAERLKDYERDAVVRAAVILNASASRRVSKEPGIRTSRQELIRDTRAAASSVIREIDKVLEKYGGHRLAESVNALGSIPVETTAAGIRALGNIKHIKAILEDQPVSLLP